MLLDVAGRTLLERTHEVAVRSGCGRVLVLADDEEVARAVRGFGGEALLTDPELDSGTARIASVMGRLEADVVINLQGDAPLTDPAVVAAVAAEAARGRAPVTLPVYRIADPRDLQDPNVVKVVRAADGRVLYCSRSALPHVRDAEPDRWVHETPFWGHVGIYAYGRDFLDDFGRLPASRLEDAERLEQLRWLEAGVALQSVEVPAQGPSVDTAAQLERVRRIFAERKFATDSPLCD